MELSQIRADLRNIRYYYSTRQYTDPFFKSIGTNKIMEVVNKYNAAICNAPLQLYNLYTALYVQSKTQAVVAEEFLYGPEYIQKLNKKLLKFFQSEFAA